MKISGRELLFGIHIAQKSPEIGYAVRHRSFVVAVGLAAGQRLLVKPFPVAFSQSLRCVQ